MVTLLVIAVVCIIGLAVLVYSIAHLSLLRIGLILTCVIGGTRVGSLWLLIWLEETGRSSISYLPLVLLLWPEAALIGRTAPWSIFRDILLSVMLLIGSATVSFAIAAIVASVKSSDVRSTDPR
jgi:hypothetical protein